MAPTKPERPKVLKKTVPIAAAEVLTGTLRAGGLSDRVVALGFDQLVLYVSAVAYEAGLYRTADPAEIERYFAGVHSFYASLPPDRYPVLTGDHTIVRAPQEKRNTGPRAGKGRTAPAGIKNA
jgi:hypothetical protein